VGFANMLQPGRKNDHVFQNDTDGINTTRCMFWHEGTNSSRVLVEVSFQEHLILISTFTCTGICETE
jgi:hypothetical protein